MTHALGLTAMPAPASAPSDRVVRMRPLATAAMFGGLVGLAIGCAYLGGATARANTVRDQAKRIQAATAAGFTEEALSAAAGGLDEGALAIARRHDPYTVAGGAQRDRQAALLTARLEQLRPTAPGLRRVSLVAGPTVQPFHLASALDDSRDLDCLTQAAYYEARGEGVDGMRAVAQVVLNRARHGAFPSSVCGVVFQGAGRRSGCQFSFTCDGSMRGRVNRAAWNRAREVATRALSGYVYAPVGSATHFHTTGVAPVWRGSLIQVTQVGRHLFYRFGGRAGGSSAFTYTPRPSTASDEPHLIQAGLETAEVARQAGQAIAYTALLAQEGRELPAPETPAAKPAPRPVAAAPAPRPAPPVPAETASVAAGTASPA